MIALKDFHDRYEQLRRRAPDAVACRQLIREICSHPWQTVDQRNAAQRLVNALERLYHGARPR